MHALLIVCHHALEVGVQDETLGNFGVQFIAGDCVVAELKAVMSSTLLRLSIGS